MSGFCPGCNSSECRGEVFHYREHAERWQRISERQHDEIQRLNRALEGATRGAEKLRQQRHHEFFLRAFSMFGQGLCDRYQHDDSGPDMESMVGQVRLARRVADEAYPPPKQEPRIAYVGRTTAEPVSLHDDAEPSEWCNCGISPEPHLHLHQHVVDEPPKQEPRE